MVGISAIEMVLYTILFSCSGEIFVTGWVLNFSRNRVFRVKCRKCSHQFMGTGLIPPRKGVNELILITKFSWNFTAVMQYCSCFMSLTIYLPCDIIRTVNVRPAEVQSWLSLK